MKKLEKRLTDIEKSYLESARAAQHERYALEDYSRLWDSLDQRLGKNNKLVKVFLTEYQKRLFPPARDRYESILVDRMKSSFFFPRVMPRDIANEIRAYDLKRREDE